MGALDELGGASDSAGALPSFMLPGWVRRADRALALASSQIRLVHAATPTNAASERARLEAAWLSGDASEPAFRYDPRPVSVELCRALEQLADLVEKEEPLGTLYAERARELLLEAEMIGAIGTSRLRALALSRFAPAGTGPETDVARASALADRFLDETAQSDDATDPRGDPWVSSDDPRDPRSLLAEMTAALGKHRLPLRVIVREGLASLAATGEGVILVAAGQRLRAMDVKRTVLHEIAGHALPQVLSKRAPLGIFAFGTTRGVDDQEGRALLLEQRAGLFDASRRRELARRHLAACAALEGADFVDVVRLLLGRASEVPCAVRIAWRVARGGGLAREVDYLPAMQRVGRALACAPGLEAMMERGRVSVEAAPLLESALRPLFDWSERA